MNATIYVLARPSFNNDYRRFLAAHKLAWKKTTTRPAELLVEFAGRVCYLSFGKRQSPRSNAAYIANLIAQGHESVLEHVNWTFLLEGVSRAFSHQLVRHRVGFAFSQLSQQYADHSSTGFVRPVKLRESSPAIIAWRNAIQAASKAYSEIEDHLLNMEKNKQVSKEHLRAIRSVARSVLPNATETKVVVTANARALRHFLMVRGAIEGDVEMRVVSTLIYEMLHNDAPPLVADFRRSLMRDRTPIIRYVGRG